MLETVFGALLGRLHSAPKCVLQLQKLKRL